MTFYSSASQRQYCSAIPLRFVGEYVADSMVALVKLLVEAKQAQSRKMWRKEGQT